MALIQSAVWVFLFRPLFWQDVFERMEGHQAKKMNLLRGLGVALARERARAAARLGALEARRKRERALLSGGQHDPMLLLPSGDRRQKKADGAQRAAAAAVPAAAKKKDGDAQAANSGGKQELGAKKGEHGQRKKASPAAAMGRGRRQSMPD